MFERSFKVTVCRDLVNWLECEQVVTEAENHKEAAADALLALGGGFAQWVRVVRLLDDRVSVEFINARYVFGTRYGNNGFFFDVHYGPCTWQTEGGQG